jgi:hypothetical protein
VTLDAAYEEARAAVRLTVAAFPAGTVTVTVQRTGPSGVAAAVRGAVAAAVAGASFIVRDYEAPLGVQLTYRVTAYNAAGAALGFEEELFALPAQAWDDPWLVDLAFPTNSQQVTVESLRELAYATPVGVHRIIDRRDPVLTSAAAWTPSGELVFFTHDELERDRARASLGTGVPVLLRTPPEQGVGNIYLGVQSFVEERPRVALYWPRRFRCQVVQVGRPDPSIFIPAPPVTYELLEQEYGSYAELLAVGSYDDAAYDYPAAASEVGFAIPWLPDDI